ncbi:hypothetical protein [Salipiger sp. PrR003]|uniref:hypothetical protein n=1 Tax=Salipiger sp. PrR003 TaxID=2706776 RepID=UPI0013DC09BA|nr:hypothetical protein [Salipiger sp. PrR003]NDV50370.1 hypothetical protein [Salipiger sp. PrR003]
MPHPVEDLALTPADEAVIASVLASVRPENIGRLAQVGACREFATQYIDIDGVVDLDAVWADREKLQNADNAMRRARYKPKAAVAA